MSPDGTRVLFGGRARFTQVSPEVSAPILHRNDAGALAAARRRARDPCLDGQRGLRLRYLPHMGVTEKGLHYAMACNGSGVGMLSFLGAEVGKKLLGGTNRRLVFDGAAFPTRPLLRWPPLDAADGGQLVPLPRLAGPPGGLNRRTWDECWKRTSGGRERW
jgi:glycine/D-amino acid oxidase-like deaminating enzyme